MKKIIFAGGIISAFAIFLIVSNFSINSDYVETGMLSIDFMDSPRNQNSVIDLHETELGNQFKSLKRSELEYASNSQWQETNIALEATISENNIQKDVTFEYYSEMPPLPQKFLDKLAEKEKNPTPRRIPFMEDHDNQMSELPNEAINVDDFLDKAKKKN